MKPNENQIFTAMEAYRAEWECWTIRDLQENDLFLVIRQPAEDYSAKVVDSIMTHERIKGKEIAILRIRYAAMKAALESLA